MQRLRSICPATLATVALTAVAVGAQPAPPTPSCAAILVSSEEEFGGAFAQRFSATATTDVTFWALFPPSLKGDHLLELKVFTPNGNLYQSLMVPISDPGPGTTRRVPGYRRPLAVKVPAALTHGKAKYVAVSAPFPVGGTMIVLNSLYGEWKVQAHLDGAAQPCAPPHAFTITQ